MRPEDLEHRPEWLRQFTYYEVGDESRFWDLVRHVTSQPAVVRPDLGPLVVLPPIDEGVGEPESQGQIRHAAEPERDPWRLDLCYLWDADNGRTRYLVSWSPSAGFFTSDDTAAGLAGMGGVLTPADLPVDSGVSVGYLRGRSLHVEFDSPAQKVGGRLQTASGTFEPDAQGGGAREYLSWNLERLPDLE